MPQYTLTQRALFDRFWELEDQIQATSERTAPLQVELDEANALCEKYRQIALEKKADIELERDGPAWLDVKHEKAQIAAAMRFIPRRGDY